MKGGAALLTLLLTTALPEARAADSLAAPLQALAPLLGKTYRGEFAGSTAKRPLQDVSRWERALNGRAVRVLHSVNDGAYGGETIIMWDAGRDSLVFFYFTTAGFYTSGTMAVEGRTVVIRETVTGHPDGVTEVRSENEILEGGGFISRTRVLKDGAWGEQRVVRYREDPAASVVFR